MKRSEFRRSVLIRWRLLSASVKFSAQEALAYSFNNWGSLASTMFYILTYLAFLSIIFSRVKVIAGYDYGEILFFSLIGQINFYLLWTWSIPSIRRMAETVKSGELDVILSRPIPIAFYLSIRRIRLTALLFDGLPALIPPVIMAYRHFHTPISPLNFITGVLILLCGQLLLHSLHFIFACAAFYTGEGKAVSKLVEELISFGEAVPYEGFPTPLKQIGTILIPTLIASAISTSFMLGKNTAHWWLVPIISLTGIFLYIKIKMWQHALRNYSSASS